MHGRRSQKSSCFPRIAGVQWSSTVESTLWRMASGMAVVLGVVLGLAEIAPVSLWLLQASWRLLWRVPSSRRGVATFRGSCRPGSFPGQGRGCFQGTCPCRSRVPRRGKFEGGTGSWQYSGWSSAEQSCAASQVPTVSPQRPVFRNSDRSWRTRLRSLPL